MRRVWLSQLSLWVLACSTVYVVAESVLDTCLMFARALSSLAVFLCDTGVSRVDTFYTLWTGQGLLLSLDSSDYIPWGDQCS